MILGTDVRLESPNPTPFIYQAKWKTWPIHILPISKIDPIHILFLKIDPIHILFFKFYPFIYCSGEKDTPLIYFWCKNDTHSYTGRPEKYTPFQPHICIYLYNGSYPPVKLTDFTSLDWYITSWTTVDWPGLTDWSIRLDWRDYTWLTGLNRLTDRHMTDWTRLNWTDWLPVPYRINKMRKTIDTKRLLQIFCFGDYNLHRTFGGKNKQVLGACVMFPCFPRLSLCLAYCLVYKHFKSNVCCCLQTCTLLATKYRGVARRTFVRKNVHIVFAKKKNETKIRKEQKKKKGGERAKDRISYSRIVTLEYKAILRLWSRT